MKTHIKTKNFDLTQAIKEHVDSRVAELEKFIQHPLENVEVWVDIGKTTMHHKNGEVYKAAIDVKTPGKIFRSKETNVDLYIAINEARDGMQRELKRFKEKNIDNSRKQSRLIKLFKNFRGKDEV